MLWFILWIIGLYLSVVTMVSTVTYCIFTDNFPPGPKYLLASVLIGLLWPVSIVLLTGLLLIEIGLITIKDRKGLVK